MGSPGERPSERLTDRLRDHPDEVGAAAGLTGPGGVAPVLAAVANVDRTRAAMKAVKPATARGTLKVLGLLALILGLALLGNLLVPSVGVVWLVIAAAVVIGINEQRRRSREAAD